MAPRRRTVADMRALKGQGQMTMLYVETHDEARAAAAAGIDVLSIPFAVWTPAMREAAGACLVQAGIAWADRVATYEDYLRAALAAIHGGADCFYCAAGIDTITRLAAEGVPVVGHVGLIPSKATWTGGFRAVGKTADTAMLVWQQVRALEHAGAFAAEIEVVPDRVTAEICRRTSLLMFSMGAGTGGDAQYLFTEDVLGHTRGHKPRHAKSYRDFHAEYDRLQAERIAAFAEFVADVRSGAYPGPEHRVAIDDTEFSAFLARLPDR